MIWDKETERAFRWQSDLVLFYKAQADDARDELEAVKTEFEDFKRMHKIALEKDYAVIETLRSSGKVKGFPYAPSSDVELTQ